MASYPSLINRIVAIDTETSGLDWWQPDFTILGVSIAFEDGQGSWYTLKSHPRLFSWLRDELPQARLVIAHHLKFDLHVLQRMGVDMPSRIWCTMTVEALIDEHQLEYGLGAVAWKYAGRGKLDPEIDGMEKYAIRDVEVLPEIWRGQVREVEVQDLDRVVDLEMRLLPVLAEMERVGVRVDLGAAHRAIPELDRMAAQLQSDINRETGRDGFNVNSPKQMRELFVPDQLNKFTWRLRDGTLTGPTKNGDNPTLDQKTLREMKDPVAGLIMRLRKTIKTRDTFIKGHIIGHADQNGYVHTTFNQTKTDNETGTGPGRMSSTDPALQQINKRDPESAKIVRAMFLPDPGYEWLCCDYDQVDFRMCAHLIQDPRLFAAYAEDAKADFHQLVSDLTGIPRNPTHAGAPNSKQLNLSLCFGAGPGKIAFTMGMPYTISEMGNRLVYEPGPEAQAVFAVYHQKFPKMKKFMKYAGTVAVNRGFVHTAMGRRLRFPRGVGAHKAAGLLYQSYAADMHKLGLIAVADAIRGTEFRLLLSVHDEVGLSGPPADMATISRIVEQYTDSSKLGLRVPITCSQSFGVNWYEASK